MATTFLEASCCAQSGLFEKWGAREQSGALLVALWGAAAGPVMQYEEYRLRGHSTTHCVILGKTPGPRCHPKAKPPSPVPVAVLGVEDDEVGQHHPSLCAGSAQSIGQQETPQTDAAKEECCS